MPSEVAIRLMREQEELAAFVAAALSPEAELIYMKRVHGDRRIYRFGARIAKVHRLHDGKAPCTQDIRRL